MLVRVNTPAASLSSKQHYWIVGLLVAVGWWLGHEPTGMRARRGRRKGAKGSGSGLNAVRALRNLRHEKANVVTQVLNEEAEQNEDDFMAKFRKFKSVARKHKKAARRDAHQFSWLRTHNKLAEDGSRIEMDLKTNLSRSRAAVCSELLDAMEESSKGVRSLKQQLIGAWKQARDAVRAARRRKVRSGRAPRARTTAARAGPSADAETARGLIGSLSELLQDLDDSLREDLAATSSELSGVGAAWADERLGAGSSSSRETREELAQARQKVLSATRGEVKEGGSVAYEDCIGGFIRAFAFDNLPSPDGVDAPGAVEIRDMYRGRMDALDRKVAEELCRATVEFKNKSATCTAELGGEGGGNGEGSGGRYAQADGDADGEWTADQGRLLAMLYKQYGSSGEGPNKLLFERLRIEFPGHSVRHLKLRHELQESRRFFLRRRKALLSQWEHDKRELLEQASTQLSAYAHAQEYEREREEELLEEEARREVGRQEHEKARLKFIEKQALKRAEQKQQEAIDRAREQAEAEKRDRERDRSQKRLLKYHQEKMEREERERELAEIQRIIDEDEARVQAERNKERVEFRRERLAEKKEERLQKEFEQERKRMAAEYRLEALRMQVASQFEHVEADPNRVVQPTQAFQTAVDTKRQKPFFAVNGFNIDQLMQDQRYKIAAALNAAGLYSSDYAKVVLQKAAPAQKPSMRSNFDF